MQIHCVVVRVYAHKNHYGERNRIGEGNAGAESDKRIHIGHAAHKGLKSAREILIVDAYYHGRQNELIEGEPALVAVVGIEEGRYRSPPHMAHRNVHQGDEHDDGDYEFYEQNFIRAHLFGGGGILLGIYAVAELAHGGKYLLLSDGVLIEVDLHRLAHERHLYRVDAVEFADSALYARRTGRTRHAGDNIIFYHTSSLILYYGIIITEEPLNVKH